MVLFLFIIMLLDVDKVETAYRFDRIRPWRLSVVSCSWGRCLSLPLARHTCRCHRRAVASNPDLVSQSSGIPFTSSSKSFGYSLFTKYMLPFQLVGFLLLAAMLGVIVISKRVAQTD